MSSGGFGIRGLEACIRRLRRARAGVLGGLRVGLMRAGRMIQRYSLDIVPVDQGPLRASSYCLPDGPDLRPIVRIGYSISYAIYVHEDLEKAHGERYNRKYAAEISRAKTAAQKAKWHRRRPQEQAKYLERPFREHHRHAMQIVRAATVGFWGKGN